MKCTRCKKELKVGDWFCVTTDYSDDVSLPFCSFHCQGVYFTKWTSKVTQELLDKLSEVRDDDYDRQADILEDEQW